MGLGIFRRNSFCSCDTTASQLGNPNPARYNIIAVEQLGNFLICTVDYPDCTNYEGRKILVYADATEQTLRRQTRLDPHFCKGDHLSPIARFEPTPRGLQMARILIGALT